MCLVHVWHFCCFGRCMVLHFNHSMVRLISSLSFYIIFDDAWWTRWPLLWGTTPVGPLLPLSCCVACHGSRYLGEPSWASWSCHLPGHLYGQCPAGGYVVLGGTLGVAVPMVCCCIGWGVGCLGVVLPAGICCQYCAAVLDEPVHRRVCHCLSAVPFPLRVIAFAVLP